jgi:hypothetical protein
VGREKTRLFDPRIDPLRKQIERWRQTRAKRSPMPESLWRAAAELAREHGVYAAAQALQVSYASLRTRAEAAPEPRQRRREDPPRATFVELPPAVLSTTAGVAGPIVEVRGPSGQRLTVRLCGDELDLAELIRACWSGRA